MCVDQCAMNALEKESKGHHRQRRSPMNCANKLRSVPLCKALSQMQYKNSPDKMELTLNFQTGNSAHHHDDSNQESEKAHHDPKFPLLNDDGDGTPFKRAKPPFILKHKSKKKHRNRGKHHHSTSNLNHPNLPFVLYQSRGFPPFMSPMIGPSQLNPYTIMIG